MKSVCFVVLTSYQLLLADAFINYIHFAEKEIKIVLILVGIELDYENDLVEEIVKIKNLNYNKLFRVWQRLYYGGYLFRISPLGRIRSINSENMNVYLFMFNDKEPITFKVLNYCKKNGRCISTVIEEGVGMYANSGNLQLTYKEKIRLFATTILGSPMQYRSIADTPLVDNCIVSKPELFSQLKKSNGKHLFMLDKRQLFDNCQDFLTHTHSSELNEIESFQIMFLGQNINGYGRLIDSEQQYMERVFNLLDGFRILIKPHPSDRDDKYQYFEKNENIKVLKGKLARLPIESIFKKVGIYIILSDNSTAGLNIADYYPSVKCIFLRNLYGRPYSFLDNRHSIRNEAVYSVERNNVFFPKTENELLDLLKDAPDNTRTVSKSKTNSNYQTIKTILSTDCN